MPWSMGCATSTAVDVVAPSSNSIVPRSIPTQDSESFRRGRRRSVEAELDSMKDDVSVVLDVQDFLTCMQLQQYWPAFYRAGLIELSALMLATEADFRRLQPPMKPGHIKKVVKNIKRQQCANAERGRSKKVVTELKLELGTHPYSAFNSLKAGARCSVTSTDRSAGQPIANLADIVAVSQGRCCQRG
jgi:hypothetical protein